MLGCAKRLFPRKAPPWRPVMVAQARRIILTRACLKAIGTALADATARRHEGIVYLFGQTDGFISLIGAAFRPEASTTRGSFHVDLPGMRHVIEAANGFGLQVVGQLHTHPNGAFHSEGDVDGALIRFGGFVSIVVPDYGDRLPSLKGAAVYMFGSAERAFVELKPAHLHILQELLP